MARSSTTERVHRAVLELVAEFGPGGLTMEGIAARAGAGKQTLYRNWPSTTAIVFDALLARDADGGETSLPDTGELRADLLGFLEGAAAAMTEPANEALLRALAARIQLDEAVAAEFRERLHEPQLRAVRSRLDGVAGERAGDAAEALLAPIIARWFLRSASFERAWLAEHVDAVLGRFAG